VAGSGWATVAVGSQLGSQLGYPANLRDAVAAEPRSSRDRGSGTARRHPAAADYALTGLALIFFGVSGCFAGSGAPPAARLHGDSGRAGQAVHQMSEARRSAAGRHGSPVVQHRPHPTNAGSRPARTTGIGRHATSSHRGDQGSGHMPVPRCPPGNGLSRSSSRRSEMNRERGGVVGGFLYRGQVGPGRAGCRERGQPVGGVVGGFFSRCTGVVHPTSL